MVKDHMLKDKQHVIKPCLCVNSFPETIHYKLNPAHKKTFLLFLKKTPPTHPTNQTTQPTNQQQQKKPKTPQTSLTSEGFFYYPRGFFIHTVAAS